MIEPSRWEKLKLKLFFLKAKLNNEYDLFIEDTKRLIRPWLEDPVKQLHGVALCFRRTFIFHQGNNRFRKLMVVVFSAVWIVAFLAATFNEGSPPGGIFMIFTAFVFLLIGGAAGVEWQSIDPIQLTFGNPGQNDSPDPDDEE